jgi:hypothetical protein
MLLFKVLKLSIREGDLASYEIKVIKIDTGKVVRFT